MSFELPGVARNQTFNRVTGGATLEHVKIDDEVVTGGTLSHNQESTFPQ